MIFCISVGNMCTGALQKVPRVALKQRGEGRSEAVQALQLLLCHFGSPFLPELSLLKKKYFFLLFFISPDHYPLLPSNKQRNNPNKTHNSTEVAITA